MKQNTRNKRRRNEIMKARERKEYIEKKRMKKKRATDKFFDTYLLCILTIFNLFMIIIHAL